MVFASTRAGTLTLKTFLPNSDLFRIGPDLNAGQPEQMTFLLNSELAPAMMQDGRISFTVEKATPDFYQLSGRRMNWDLTDYHPLLAQRAQSTSTFDDMPMPIQMTFSAAEGNAPFQPLFGPGSREEAPIVGRLAAASGPLIVSGQIDRLVVTDDAVLIADYKTDQSAPHAAAEVPRPYLRQLALYRAVLGKVYPDRPVRAALVWTAVPELMELPAEILDQEVANLTCS